MSMVRLSHGEVHYQEKGEGLPIILLHANPGDGRDFESIIEPLSRHYRVLALDWPGYGRSMPFDVEKVKPLALFDQVLKEFIQVKQLGSVIIMGNSVGGNVAVRYAAIEPSKVAGLILVSPGGFTAHNWLTRLFCQMQGSRFSLPPSLWARMYLKVNNVFTGAMLSRAAVEQATPDRKKLNRCVWRAFLKPEHDVRAAAKSVLAPTLLVFGRRDPAIRAKQDGLEATTSMPAAQMAVLPCGHAAFAEMPDVFIQLVESFLAQCTGRCEQASAVKSE